MFNSWCVLFKYEWKLQRTENSDIPLIWHNTLLCISIVHDYVSSFYWTLSLFFLVVLRLALGNSNPEWPPVLPVDCELASASLIVKLQTCAFMTDSELPKREKEGSGIRWWRPGVEDGLTEDGMGRGAMDNTLLSYFNWKALLPTNWTYFYAIWRIRSISSSLISKYW